MTTSSPRTVHFSLAVLIFFVILTSTLLVESICHAYLPAEAASFSPVHFVIEPIAAFFASLLFLVLLIRAQILSREAERKELLQKEEDWKKTFDSMTDFVSIHDREFRIVKANKAMCEFLGKEPEEIVGQLCYQVFHRRSEPYESCPHEKTAGLGHPVTEVVSDPDIGFPLRITCSPLYDNNGSFQGSLHMARVPDKTQGQGTGRGAIIPICASCKNIRDGADGWLSPEEYFLQQHAVRFTHTLCRECQQKLYPGFVRK